ncbi:MAG: lysophospholipid acyltransferase family protein [Phycisphaerae bacterium]
MRTREASSGGVIRRDDTADSGAAGAASLTDRSAFIPLFTRARIGWVRTFLMTWVHCFSLSGLYKLGQCFGFLEYLTDYKRRRRVHRKLLSLFGDQFDESRRRRLTCRYFMRIRCDKMFYTIMDRIPRNKLMNRIKLFGLSHIDDALRKGNGVYVALCHFGSHHIAGLIMALLGYELAGIRDSRESPVRRFIQQKYRETFPEVSKMKLFPATSFPRGIYRHLQGNKIVASLLDADRKRGERTKTLPAVLFGCRSTTLQGFVVSRRNFYFQLIITPPLIDPEAVEDETEAIACALRRYAEVVERFARENPDHLMNI